jgi:hypothetical protein
MMDRIRPILPGLGLDVNANIAGNEGQVVLNAEQSVVVERMVTLPGRYMITGAAGTGKSTVLRALCGRLIQEGTFEPVILAPSGVAAVNVRGWTIHRFFGAGVQGQYDSGFDPDLYTLDWNLHQIKARGRVPYVVVDEVSMISADQWTIISQSLTKVAFGEGGSEPFGGFHVAAFGDFGQLGPIVKTSHGQVDDHGQWLWFSEEFDKFEHMTLSQPCRQMGDNLFFQLLSVVREGPRSETVRNVCGSNTQGACQNHEREWNSDSGYGDAVREAGGHRACQRDVCEDNSAGTGCT